MSFKNIFIKEDEEQTKQATSSGQSVQTGQAGQMPHSVSQNVGAVSRPVQSASISADSAIVNTIWEKIVEKNRPGPDYLELKNNVEALEDLPISPEQKIMSAFKVLQKNYPNFKKDDIITAIDFYIKVVEEEKATGLSELDALREQNVNSVSSEISRMQESAAELKRKYDDIQEKIATKSVEMNNAKADIEMKYNTFTGSVDAVMNVLNSDKEKIIAINF